MPVRSSFTAHSAMNRLIVSPLIILAGLAALVIFEAQSARAGGSSCDVLVKVLEGIQGADAGESRGLPAALASDVGSQLDMLPFSSYEVLDSHRQTIAMGSQGLFKLVGHDEQQHTLRVHPHYYSHKKIGLTVMWNGPRNEELLSTKMHVANGKCVVLGTDGRQASTILTVKLECSSP